MSNNLNLMLFSSSFAEHVTAAVGENEKKKEPILEGPELGSRGFLKHNSLFPWISLLLIGPSILGPVGNSQVLGEVRQVLQTYH